MHRKNIRSITYKVPGTCGELVQGAVNGRYFHITCPVDIYSYVSVSCGITGAGGRCMTGKWKSISAVHKTLERFNAAADIDLEIRSDIPAGRGMASSTADVTGACLGAADLLNKNISPDEVAQIALGIEPSDGIMFKGIVMFDHRQGRVREMLGRAPDIRLLIIDTGRQVNTIEQNKGVNIRDYRANEKEIEKAVKLVKKGMKTGNISLIGEGATISALCNQKVLFKPELEKVIDAGLMMNAEGVNVAHSGSVIGILLHPEYENMRELKDKIRSLFSGNITFYETRLVNGGAERCILNTAAI
jgi:L-threonine kinase